MKGCYVYCCDKPLAEYLAAQLAPQHESIPKIRIEPEVNDEVKYIDFLPLYSIRAACGYFGEGEMVDESGWMKVESMGKLNRNMFIVQAVGHSMEPFIYDGDYCVFRVNPAGSRQGKIVLAEHHNYYDPDYAGSYSIKTYTSKKTFDTEGNWIHEEIVLQPKIQIILLSSLKKKIQMSSELSVNSLESCKQNYNIISPLAKLI